MARFASGKKAFGFCDICGFREKLRNMKRVVEKRKDTGLLACPSCWDKDHPQNMLGEYPVHDPQGLRVTRQTLAWQLILVPLVVEQCNGVGTLWAVAILF